MKKISRREFLAASSLTGYSLIVNAESLLASQPLQDTPPHLTEAFTTIAPAKSSAGAISNEPNMTLVELQSDIMIAGGGMAGVCAAISAARQGSSVILVQDRSRLGGNASSEIKMHIVGADQHGSRAGWRESGLLEEFRLEDAVHNPHRAWELWDLMLYDKVISEKNITLLLDSILYAAEVRSDKIISVGIRCDKTEHIYNIKADIFLDCTGDSRLALEAGAEFRVGRESLDEFGETLAVHEADRRTQGSSILFTAREHDYAIPYKPPTWARKISKEDLKYRGVGSSWEYGYWWIELGGMYDTIRDNERLRFELLSVVLGVWDHIKNSGNYPESKNWALQTVGMIPGKRESRRVIGDHIVTQNDLMGAWRTFDDAVAIGGWAMDDHPPEGFDAPEKRPYRSVKLKEPYNIPFSALYSKNIRNMMMAGRNISCSHVGFSSTRVMGTTSVVGQAAGTAAAICIRNNITPRELRRNKKHLQHLQQTLLRDDQTIREIKNEDPDDLARSARVTASHSIEGCKPENIVSGVTRDLPDEWQHRWGAPVADKPFIELSWDQTQSIRHIQIVFDSGFQRQLTLTASDHHNSRIVRSAQPETVRDYSLQLKRDGRDWQTIAEVSGNYQRLRRHEIAPIKASALRLTVSATNGAPEARVYEIRCYS